jgi:DNA-binding transcriptional MerR regulator
MITTTIQYEQAQAELLDLQQRLEQLQRLHSLGEKGFTKAGIRKLIARLNEELAVFEGSEEARSSSPN